MKFAPGRLCHFSSVRTIIFGETKQEDYPGMKPRGLWISDEWEEESWSTWCQKENYRQGPGAFDYKHEIELADNNKVLHIQNKTQLLEFVEKYGVSSYQVDWKKVAKRYQGIIITPYIWECRLGQDTNWYYGWDCASGCIWDSKAIKSIKSVKYELKEMVEA